jgi:phage recombination protein Bet
MNELIKHQEITKDTLISYLEVQGLTKKLTKEETTQFLQIAMASGLNPFKREVYAIKYGSSLSIITGYEVYLKRANATGKLNGWKTEVITEGNELAAKVTINRKDFEFTFEHTVYMSEAKQESPIWKKMPKFMLKKVAIAQAFRLCFPEEMGGMPYTQDEITVEGVASEMATDQQLDRIREILEGLDNKEKQLKWLEGKGGLMNIGFADAQTFIDGYEEKEGENGAA